MHCQNHIKFMFNTKLLDKLLTSKNLCAPWRWWRTEAETRL